MNNYRESAIENRLVQGVKTLGGRAYKFASPGNIGVPDRIVILPGGVILFAEIKTTKGQLSVSQQIQINELRRIGADVHVIKGMENVAAFLTVCREKVKEAIISG